MTPATKFPLRDYQQRAVTHTVETLARSESPRRLLYVAPTGTGKSLILLSWLDALAGAILITPRVEIIVGMLDKLGKDTDGMSTAKLVKEALATRITTPIRLRNLLAKGELPFRPSVVLIDECHHSIADTYALLPAYLPEAHWCGVTATPFRGTPRGSAEFLKLWEDAYYRVLSLQAAADAGYIAIPTVDIWPLVDDDTVEVANGELRAVAAGEAVKPRLQDVVDQCKVFVTASESPPLGGDSDAVTKWNAPTLFAVPTTEVVHDLVDRLNAAGLPAVGVTQDTSRADRATAFADCLAGRRAVVQIDVVSEGVDLPIRRLIDLRPTLSPVRWLQQLGRITRPRQKCPCTLPDGTADWDCTSCQSSYPVPLYIDPPSQYVCCCRNLERHGYLMEGLFPPAYISKAQSAFGKPSQRSTVIRAVGLEGVGRFKPADVQLDDGCTGSMYSLYAHDGFHKTEYAILLHPCNAEPLVASRQVVRDETGTARYGRWVRVPALPGDLKGYQSSPPGEMSERQAASWQQHALRHGLSVLHKPTRKTFAALPVLRNVGAKFTVGGW